jgi:hypothetical protein
VPHVVAFDEHRLPSGSSTGCQAEATFCIGVVTSRFRPCQAWSSWDHPGDYVPIQDW